MSAPLLLAIEPRAETASALRGLVAERIDGTLTLVDSVDEAVAAIDRQMPEVILVSPLLAPKDEAELFARLRALPNGRYVQTLITPFLAQTEPQPKRGFFRFKSAQKSAGCAPSGFADEVQVYLDRARQLKAAAAADAERVSAERRSTSRVVRGDDSIVTIDGATVELVDLSATGAQVLSPTLLVPGRLVPVVFQKNQDAIRCLAAVVWGEFDVAEATRTPRYRAGMSLRLTEHALLDRMRLPVPPGFVPPGAPGSVARPRLKQVRPRAHRYDRADLPSASAIKSPLGTEMRIVNISKSGMLLETSSKLTPGAIYEMQLGSGDAALTVRARILRTDVASVDRRGVKYHAAATFEEEIEI